MVTRPGADAAPTGGRFAARRVSSCGGTRPLGSAPQVAVDRYLGGSGTASSTKINISQRLDVEAVERAWLLRRMSLTPPATTAIPTLLHATNSPRCVPAPVRSATVRVPRR